jgi:hypothetical protein
MSGYVVARVDDIPELDDGRAVMRPVRHHRVRRQRLDRPERGCQADTQLWSQAIELSERFRDFAKGDSDLDAIRGEPAYQELVASPPGE